MPAQRQRLELHIMGEVDLAAFERAAALLRRDEHLDDDDAYGEPLSTEAPSARGSGAATGARRRAAAAAAPRVPLKGRRQGPNSNTDGFTAPPGKVLPTLAELSQRPSLAELSHLDLPQKMAAPARAGRRAAAPAEQRKAVLRALDAALPSLDDESARLVARARALLDSHGADPAVTGVASPARRQPKASRSEAPPRPTARSAPASSGGGADADASLSAHDVGDAELAEEEEEEEEDKAAALAGSEGETDPLALLAQRAGALRHAAMMPGADLAAFERAAALLRRDEHLDDDGGSPSRASVGNSFMGLRSELSLRRVTCNFP